MSIRTLLVDDHTMFREALGSMLARETGIEVVGELGDPTQVEAAVARLLPDVVVMDVSMPKVNGIEATRGLLSSHPDTRVVALSAFEYPQFIMGMMEAGATAYVVKSAAGDQLVRAIISASQSKVFLCPAAAATLIAANRRGSVASHGASRDKPLSRRETEVLRLLADGMSSPQIAQSLHLSTGTVEVHRRNLMRKLQLRTIAGLTKHAIRIGLVQI